jgi:uncharacterized protein
VSKSPTDIISELYAAFARGDIPAIVGMVAEDVDWRVPENLPHGGDFHGRDGVMRFFQGLGANWDGLELDLDEVVPLIVEIHGDGRSKLNGYTGSAAISSSVDV